jgi:hypothetical protein
VNVGFLRTRSAIAPALLVIAMLAACSGSPRSGPPTRSTAPVSETNPSVGPSPIPSKRPVRLRVSTVAQFVLSQWRSVGHLALEGPDVLFVGCQHCREGDNPNQVVALDLRTGHQRVLARSSFRGGITDWVEGSGGAVVFTDSSRVQSDDDANTRWTLDEVALTGGPVHVLDSSHGRSDPDLPIVRAGGGYAVWPAADRQHHEYQDIRIANLTTLRQRVVATGVKSTDIGVGDGRIVFGTTDGDVHSVTLDGRSQVAVYQGGSAAWARVTSGGLALWAEPRYDDPSSLWTAPTSGGSARQVFTGYNQMAVAGSDFAAFLGDPDAGAFVTVVPLVGGSPITIDQQPWAPTRFAASGDEFAYGTAADNENPPVTLHVVRVVTAS